MSRPGDLQGNYPAKVSKLKAAQVGREGRETAAEAEDNGQRLDPRLMVYRSRTRGRRMMATLLTPGAAAIG